MHRNVDPRACAWAAALAFATACHERAVPSSHPSLEPPPPPSVTAGGAAEPAPWLAEPLPRAPATAMELRAAGAERRAAGVLDVAAALEARARALDGAGDVGDAPGSADPDRDARAGFAALAAGRPLDAARSFAAARRGWRDAGATVALDPARMVRLDASSWHRRRVAMVYARESAADALRPGVPQLDWWLELRDGDADVALLRVMLPVGSGVDWSPTGDVVATTDGAVALWDAVSGRLLDRLAGPSDPRQVAFSADGRHLAVRGATAIEVRKRSGELESAYSLASGEAYAVALDATGTRLAVATERAVVEIVVRGKRTAVLVNPSKPCAPSDDWCPGAYAHLAFTDRNRLVAITPAGELTAFDLAGGHATVLHGGVCDDDDLAIHGAASSRDCPVDSDITVDGAAVLARLGAPEPTGVRVVGTARGDKLGLWAFGAAPRSTPPFDTGVVAQHAYHALEVLPFGGAARRAVRAAGGSRIVDVSRDARAAVVVEPGAATLWDLASARALLRAPGAWTLASLSADGSLLALGSERDVVELWATSSGERIATLDHAGARIFQLAFAPTGLALAVAAGQPRYDVLLWAPPFERPRRLGAERAPIADLLWSPDGTVLASVADARYATLWSPDASAPPERLGELGFYTRAAISPRGRALAVVGQAPTTGRNIRVFALPGGEPLTVLPIDYDASGLQFLDEERLLVTGGAPRIVDPAGIRPPMAAPALDLEGTIRPLDRRLLLLGPRGATVLDPETLEPIARLVPVGDGYAAFTATGAVDATASGRAAFFTIVQTPGAADRGYDAALGWDAAAVPALFPRAARGDVTSPPIL
jgi:WD40 repeat protein